MTTHSGEGRSPNHAEADPNNASPASENPIGNSFNIVVSVPDSIKVRMVDASALGDYEVWIFIASLLCNAVVGFAVAYFQAVDAHSPSTTYGGYTLLMFIVLFCVSLGTAFHKRRVIRTKGRDIRLRTSSATLEN
jgi:hypothetical protein